MNPERFFRLISTAAVHDAEIFGSPGPQARRRSAELPEPFGLTGPADRAAKTYSGGMRRRVDLAARLVGRPKGLYLDEPTTGLKPKSRLGMWAIIRSLVADGTTVLLT